MFLIHPYHQYNDTIKKINIMAHNIIRDGIIRRTQLMHVNMFKTKYDISRSV